MKHNSILLLWDRMGDYHRARWAALREGHDGDVWAADWCASDDLYHWDATTEARHVSLNGPGMRAWWRCVRLIQREGIRSVGVPGYGRPGYVLLLLWLRLTGRKVILFAESWNPGSVCKDRLKGMFLRGTVDGFFVSGQRARDHFHERLGIPMDLIRTGYSVVDNGHFAPKAVVELVPSSINEAEHQEIKPKVLLCVARFAPEKGLDLLLKAFAQSDLPQKGWTLKLVGGGPLADALREQAGAGVEICGWMSYEDLPALYASATVVVLPSRFEPWGLVVNEALAAGRPVLVSDAVGAAPDLVTPETGWVFPEGDENELCRKLTFLDEMGDDTWKRMCSGAVESVAHFRPQDWARNFQELAG